MDDVRLYRTVWRWHFFAGLITLPVLAWMAVTGALYLYKPELERALYPDLVASGAKAPPLPVAGMIARVEARTGREVTQVAAPAAAGDSWRMTLADPGREGRLAFVRPDTGELLGTSRTGGPLELVKRLHSLTVAGAAGNILVEIVAGWAIVLVLSGLYLWWPRGANRALSLAGRATERRFWRNLHASTGLVAGVVILFLAVTGMPWTIFWGAQFHRIVAQEQIGRPPPPDDAGGHAHDTTDAHLPWSLRGASRPHGSHGRDIGPDRAVAAAAGRGLDRPWILDPPAAPGQSYRISAGAEGTSEVRLIHVDPASGKVLQDVRYSDFGIGAKAFEWGIYTHQGQQYGEVNRLVMLAGCLGMLGLAISAPVMWWKRRDGGRLRAPPAAAPASARGALAVMLAIGALFPLTGATMIAAICGAALKRRLAAVRA